MDHDTRPTLRSNRLEKHAVTFAMVFAFASVAGACADEASPGITMNLVDPSRADAGSKRPPAGKADAAPDTAQESPPITADADVAAGGTGGTAAGGSGGSDVDATTTPIDATVPPSIDGGDDAGAPDAVPTVTPTRSGDPTKGLKAPQITWGPCADNGLDDCGKVTVPLDYLHPEGEQITLALGRLKARDPQARIGSVLLNPGGPGESGTKFLRDFKDDFSEDLRARFDLIAWDPRGVPESAAVDCKAMPSMPEIDLTYDTTAKTPNKDLVKQIYKTWVSQCKAGSRLLPFISTDDTVSDLELLRAAVGDAKLSYVGFSYGTAIGQHYLLRYPDRVRAMVLDGVDSLFPVAPSAPEVDGFEGALAGFLKWCANAPAKDCPFARATPKRIDAFDALFESLRTKPVPIAGGKQLTFAAAQYGVLNDLYLEDLWPNLGAALEDARLGKGERLYAAGAQYTGPPGPSEDPFLSIWCADGGGYTEADVDKWASQSTGRFDNPYAALVCVGWPVANLTREPVVPAKIPPIVLVGNTGDPATPYAGAVSANKHLPGSVLVTSKSFTHTAYLYGDPCIDKPIDDYLVSTKMPRTGITCTPPKPKALADGTVALQHPVRPRPRPRPYPKH